MTTYNTGNPIGSTDARDRLDNTENMDYLENSRTELTHPDRLGAVRKTRHGMEVEHDNQISAHEVEHDNQISAHEAEYDAQMQSFENDFDGRLAGMAFTRVGSFTTGATLTDMRQVLIWEVSQGGDGHEYGWAGAFPKVVAAGATPATSGGIGSSAWVDRTDLTLRSEINIVQKRFACVADMVADTSLVTGQAVEFLSYQTGLGLGGNYGFIVSGGTGADDGGTYITLNNGLQFEAINKTKLTPYNFGKVDGDDISSLIATIKDLVIPIGSSFVISSFTSQTNLYSSQDESDLSYDVPAIGNPQFSSRNRVDAFVEDGSDRQFITASQVFSGDSYPALASLNPFNDFVAGYFGAYRGANAAGAPMAINGLVQIVPRTQIVANLSGTTVTWVSGEKFRPEWVNSRIVIEGSSHVTAKIASVESDTSMTLVSTLGSFTNATILIGNSATVMELDMNCGEYIDVNSPISFNGLNVASGGSNSPLIGINVSATNGATNAWKMALLLSNFLNYGIRVINPQSSAAIGFDIRNGSAAQSYLKGGNGLRITETDQAIQHVPLSDSDTAISMYGTNAANSTIKWRVYQNGDTTFRAYPYTYSETGVKQSAEFIMRGSATIGSSGYVEVYMTNKNYTTSYLAFLTNTTSVAACKYTYNSLNKFTIYGTVGDVINWMTIGS